MHRVFFHCLLLFVLAATPAAATLILNGAQPITERVTVQVITTAATNGTDAAPAFGNATQQSAIFGGINAIWAQAGIDVQFKFRLANWNNDFALLGNITPRSQDDLDTIVTNASNAGLLDPNPLVINLFLVRIVPGFSQTSDNTSNGLAFVDDNGITLWAGPNLVSFANGRDVIASVLAHEIGHNLNLDHITATENLMQSSGGGERLNASQIALARASAFSVPIPEPRTLTLLLVVLTSAAASRSVARSPQIFRKSAIPARPMR